MTETDAEDEEFARLEELFDPLFDRFLKLEREFSTFALDSIGATDDDVVRYAEHFRHTQSPSAQAYFSLLGCISHERTMRFLNTAFEVVRPRGLESGEMMSVSDIMDAYHAMDKGKA